MKAAVATVLLTAPLLTFGTRPLFVSKNYTSTFEVPNSNEILGEPDHLPGPYNGLQWNINFTNFVDAYADNDCLDVCPSTFPQAVEFNVTDAPNSASLSTDYKDSRVVDFELNQFDFGCLSIAQYNLPYSDLYFGVPANCTLTVHGFKGTDESPNAKPDVTAQFTYIPVIRQAAELPVPVAEMITAKFPAEFKGLKSVTFNATLLRGVNETYYGAPPAVRLDTFHYVTRNFTAKA